MLRYLVHRLFLMVPTIIAISVVTFILIQLPPGDFLSVYVAGLAQTGEQVDEAELDALAKRYGLNQPMYTQYTKWCWNMLHGDMGVSFEWNRPVKELIWGRIGLTFVLSFISMIVNWCISFPIGIYSAVRQYSWGDYLFTFLAFTSAAIPHFLIALVLMWILLSQFGITITGLFSPEYAEAPWTFGRVLDMLKHAVPAIAILGFLGGAGLIRTMRANLLDELNKPYVVTARSKGLSERKVLLKYPIRIALIPFVATIGWALPGLISGTTIVAIVLGLPTAGPLLFRALMSQDMYLAGSFLFLLSVLTVIGTFISDLSLAWLDPRIRYAE
jgi:peptide/nickel transport system permease protein